jgi:hypothetical protein
MQSLRAQGKEEQAAAAERRFRAAWSRADVVLAASRFNGDERATMTAMKVAAPGRN